MNANPFCSVEAENRALIYSFTIAFAARHNSSIEQAYLKFKLNISYSQADDHSTINVNVNLYHRNGLKAAL